MISIMLSNEFGSASDIQGKFGWADFFIPRNLIESELHIRTIQREMSLVLSYRQLAVGVKLMNR